MSTSDPITVLTTDQCWERLRGEEFGRLASHLTDEVHICLLYTSPSPRD